LSTFNNYSGSDPVPRPETYMAEASNGDNATNEMPEESWSFTTSIYYK